MKRGLFVSAGYGEYFDYQINGIGRYHSLANDKPVRYTTGNFNVESTLFMVLGETNRSWDYVKPCMRLSFFLLVYLAKAKRFA